MTLYLELLALGSFLFGYVDDISRPYARWKKRRQRERQRLIAERERADKERADAARYAVEEGPHR